MATTTTQTLTKPPRATTTTATTTKLVCFSFAAYAKTLIDHLKSINIPILPGLTDEEFTSIESTFHFSFPPDLRSILQEGVPVGTHFPNWRSASPQQLQILLNLPSLNLYKDISQNNLWVDSWGERPYDNNKALHLARQFLDKAPTLVPIYWNCYIPSIPNVAGNPVFFVGDGEVRIQSYDVARFFQEAEFLKKQRRQDRDDIFKSPTNFKKNILPINLPVWAATAPQRIEFWTEVAEKGRRVVAREPTRGWWRSGGGLKHCLEDVFWKLRDGGWKEEEVREMMMMDGCDHARSGCGPQFNIQDVAWHVSVLSLVLLRAGWSREDVVHSLGLQDDEDCNAVLSGKAFLDFQPQGCRSRELDGDHQKRSSSSIKSFMNRRFFEV